MLIRTSCETATKHLDALDLRDLGGLSALWIAEVEEALVPIHARRIQWRAFNYRSLLGLHHPSPQAIKDALRAVSLVKAKVIKAVCLDKGQTVKTQLEHAAPALEALCESIAKALGVPVPLAPVSVSAVASALEHELKELVEFIPTLPASELLLRNRAILKSLAVQARNVAARPAAAIRADQTILAASAKCYRECNTNGRTLVVDVPVDQYTNLYDLFALLEEATALHPALQDLHRHINHFYGADLSIAHNQARFIPVVRTNAVAVIV